MQGSTRAIVLLLSLISIASCLDLVVNIHYNGKPVPSSMYLRGDGLGLNWNSGVILNSTSPTLWSGTFTYSQSDVGKK